MAYTGVATDQQNFMVSQQASKVAGQTTAPLLTYSAITVLDNSGGNGTITAAMILGGIVHMSGGTTPTNTSDTATNIINAIANPFVGAGIDVRLSNQNSGTMTLAGGTGVTVVGPTTIATTANKPGRMVITSVTTPAITWYS